MWRKELKKYQKETDWQAIVAILLFLIMAALVPSVKIFFLLAFALFSFLVLKYSFPKAFVYTSLPLSYVSMAQTHSILVVPAKAIVSNQYWEGRHLVYGFSPYFFIAIVALFLILVWNKKLKTSNWQSYHFATLAFICTGFLASFYASLMPGISLLNAIGQLSTLTLVWYLSTLLKNSKEPQRQKLLLSLFLILTMLISYESLIVFRQTITQSPIGLAIEGRQFAAVFGLGADESGGFRPFGLQAHPNGLANQQLILLCSVFLIFAYLKKKSKLPLQKILFSISALATVNMVLSLSRAAFIALFLIAAILYLRHQRRAKQINKAMQKSLPKVPGGYKLFAILILGFLFFKLSNRLLYSMYSFSEFGGVSTRAVQYAEAFEVFKKSPIFGIGDRMFIPTSYQLFPKGVMTYFPEEVHSGLLLLVIERGMLGGTIYLIFLLILLKKIRQTNLRRSTKSVLYSGIIAGLVMMIFHPEKNYFSLFILLTIAILENQDDQKFIS